MKLIKSVDPSLLDLQMSLITESLLKNPANSRTVGTLLDLIRIQHEEDGSEYATQILELIRNVDKSTTKPRVSKEIIETVFTDLSASCEQSNVFSSC